ncbi:hypothetical protein [Enterobacter hormaechei]|uniref:hypothetical protein n=1 Tax=Enterobacter hormaechei TaxID=158836 RepID=UPI003C6C0B4C
MSTQKLLMSSFAKRQRSELTGEGNLSVSISSPSVIEIQGSAQDVVRYVRQGMTSSLYERWQRDPLQ